METDTGIPLVVIIIITVLCTLAAGAIVNLIIRKAGNSKDSIEEEVLSKLEEGRSAGEIKEEDTKMINSIFNFDDVLAHEIMTPRTDVFYIDIDDDVEDYLDRLMELRYSRIPVCKGDSDNIIGIVHIKDYLIKAREEGFENVDLNSILREPYLVPETKNINTLFREMQKTKQQIAILIDEYGGFAGIVSMEDIIEQVMGDIDDEYDDSAVEILPQEDGSYLVDGNIDIDDLNEQLEIEIRTDDSETLGGYVIELLGEIPGEEAGQKVTDDNFEFTVVSVKDRRIETICLCRKND